MSTASEPKHCPKCGRPIPVEAPQGLCPKCLLLEASIPTDAGTGATSKGSPPSREELAAAFPQLEILELIGQGGMGFVFKARQAKLDRLVALKILPQSLAADPAFAERFTREGRALARLNHPNIVTVHDFGEAKGFFYLLMEFVDGVNLRQAMKVGRFTPAQALAIVPKICEALQFAHNEGILHRDIKPENILLDTKGRVKIADFGIAKLIEDRDSPAGQSGAAKADVANNLTEAGKALGTPQYMAPEQLEHPQDVDQRADIYSLGVVFYEMLTGELPIGRFAPPSEKSSADPRVDEVVLRALAKERERRQNSAGEVKTEVETITGTSHQPGLATPKGSPSRQHFRQYFSGPSRLRDSWPWDPRLAWWFLVVPVFVTSILIPLLYSRMGLHVLWFLALDVGGLGIALTYLTVGVKVRRLKTTPAAARGEIAEAVIAWRTFESPGVAILREDELELVPIAGEPVLVMRKDIVAVREVSWFNGNRLWTKTGLILELEGGARIGVALPRPIGQRWKGVLSPKTTPAAPTPAPSVHGGWKTALVLVAAAFILGGCSVVWQIAHNLPRHTYDFNVAALALPIGVGLLRRRPWWRFAALLLLWFFFGLLIFFSGLALTGHFVPGVNKVKLLGWTLSGTARFGGGLLVYAGFVALLAGMYWVLVRREVKALFQRGRFVRPWIEWAVLAGALLFAVGIEQALLATGLDGMNSVLSASSFGPAVECVVEVDHPGRAFFNLITSDYVKPPADLVPADWTSPRLAEWLATGTNADVMATLDHGETRLALCDMVSIRPVANKAWSRPWLLEEPAVQTLTNRTLARNPKTGPVDVLGSGEPPTTWVFQTRNHISGLLQILSLTDNPPKVKFRYKTLQPRAAASRTLVVGDPAPPLAVKQWFNVQAPLSLLKLRGNVVLLDFWGKWCGPCVRRLPESEALFWKCKRS